MKQNCKKTAILAKGFSLVEMLVVIGLIAALMAFLVPAIAGAKGEATRQLSSSTQISTLSMAVEQYFDEYGDYPVSWLDRLEGDAPHVTMQTTAAVMAPLLGSTEDGENRKDIAYFKADNFKKNEGGLVYKGSSALLLSPWAENDTDKDNAYLIRIDADYDDEIISLMQKSKVVRNKRVLVMAAGEDGELGYGDGPDAAQLRMDNVTNFD